VGVITSSSTPTEAALLTLKVNEALLLASTEQEILAAVGLCANKDASLYLFYVDWKRSDASGGSISIISQWNVATAIPREDVDKVYPINQNPGISAFVSSLASCEDPVWLAHDINIGDELSNTPFFGQIGSLAGIKLQSMGSSSQHRWHSVICFTWPTAHTFSPDEMYLFTTVAQFASVVVSNHRMHRQIVANVARLQELDRLKDEFLYSISHELRTPLSSIITLTEGILAGADGELVDNLRTDIEYINDSGLHLFSMISDLLDFAKIEAGSIRLEQKPVQMLEIINQAVREIRPLIDEQAKSFTIKLSAPTNLPMAWVDPTRMRQVALNLLSNAVKFSDQGSIEIQAREERGQLVVCVRDEGIGIEPDQQAIIFEKFRQINGSLTRKAGGGGLGLAICKQLIELQGGKIWLESYLGQGSSFYFSVPIFVEKEYETPVH